MTAIAQSIITMAAIVVLTNFAAQNTLYNFLVSLRALGPIETIQNPAYGSAVIPAAIIAGVVLLVALVLGGGFVYSAEYATYLEAWQTDKATFRSIIENGTRTWKRMAWTLFLSNLITWAPAAIGLIFLLLSLPNIGTPVGLAAFIGAYYTLLIGFGASLFLALFTVYSYPAVVVNQLSGLKAIRSSFQTASHNLGITWTYSVARILLEVLPTLIIAFASNVGLPLSTLTAAIFTMLLTPILHSTKTMIYYHAAPSLSEMPFTVENPIWNDIFRKLPRAAWLKIRIGLTECGRYVLGLRNIPFHAAAVLGFSLGILMGDFVSNNGVKRFYFDVLGYQPGRLNPVLTQVFPPALGVDIFLNNWLVSIAAALAGIGYAAPSFEILLFNGFIIGVIGPLIPSLTMLLAVIAPHGVIEVPSFLLAGSAGIKLGYAAIRTRTSPGQESHEYLSAALRQAVYVTIGLAPLFFIAGLIEADLTPFIARMFGWT